MNGKKAKLIRKKVIETMDKVGKDRGFKFYCRKAKDLYNSGLFIPIFIIVFFMILSCKVCYSDTFEIQSSCYPKVIQKHFADYKYKVDLSPNDRDRDSWAYLDNQGTKFRIVTYYSVGNDELILLREISISLMAELQRIENENCR